jgi:PAS domain S-box-containing protein
MSLAARLTIAMVALVLVTATAVGFLTYRDVESVAVPRALERTMIQARLLAVEIDHLVQQTVVGVRGFRAAVAIDGIIRARAAGGIDPADGTSEATWRTRMANRFVAELESNPAYNQFRVIGVADGGREIIRVDRSGPLDAIRAVPDDELQRKGGRRYFQQALRAPAGTVSVSPIELNRENGAIDTPHVPVLRVATPLFTAAGAPFGIVIINVDLRPLFGKLRSAVLPERGIYLVNEHGDYLFHPDAGREFGFEFGRRDRVQEDIPGVGGAINADQVVARVVETSDGDPLGMAVVPLDLAGYRRIALIVTDSYVSLMRPAFAVRQASLVAGLAAVFGAILLAIPLARTLARPLEKMTAAVEAFGRGQTFEIETRSAGEVGILARAFDRMATEVREKALELQRESEERRRIFDTSLDLILVVNRKGGFIQVSPSSAAILGYRPEEMVGRSAADFIFPDDLANTRNEMRMARRGRHMRNFECRYVHKDGHPVTLAWTGVWSQPELRHYFIGRDMTERRQAEEKFRLAVEACPSGMIMVDRSGTIIMVNSEIERLFGYARAELIGKPLDMLVPAGQRGHHAQLRNDFSSRPEARRMGAGRNLYARRKDGSEFSVEVGLNPVQTADGPIVLGVVVDISERQRNERMKDEFVSTVSHELRTPMTSIAGSLGLLTGGAAGALPAPAQRLLSIAYSNSQRLVRLINDILDIQKIESGKMTFDFKPVDVRGLVEQAIESNRGFALNYGTRVGLAEGASAIVRADVDRLTQVITNLLSNAIKFSPAGGEVAISIDARGDGVRVSVRDRGSGIPDEFRARIFEKFAQADASDTRQKGGTGLGLNIVKQIVAQHGGRVGFEPADGGGTIFYFELPISEGDIVPDAKPMLPAGVPRLLLCEDDSDSASTLAGQLRLAGFEITVARRAGEALARASGAGYGAILVDLKLPDLDGVSLIQRLRTLPGHADTPIIVVSACAEVARADVRSAALNVLDWLGKPVNVDHLVQVVNRAVAGRGTPRPRILHVDDDRDVLHVVAASLQSDAEVMSVQSIEDARLALAQREFDLAVLDLTLADGSSMDLLPELQNRNGRSIPVVVFSGQDANPAVAARVDALLTKSRTSIDDLVGILRGIAAKGTQTCVHKEVA